MQERRTQDIAYQVALGIQYLHGFGIVHRDIKLENIMMSDTSDNAVPKIVDFGLAKIIGPSCTAQEPFGTLGYAAPEVLSKMPYTFSCDVWSLGCIIYACLSGSLPFDHEKQEETIRMTLHEKLAFDLPVWNQISPLAKNLLTGLLEKDPRDRLTMEQAMAHPWFEKSRQKYGKQEDSLRSNMKQQHLKSTMPLNTKESSFIQKLSSTVGSGNN